MTATSIFAQQATESDNPIKDGDAVLILRRDGSSVAMTVGIDPAEAESIRTKLPTDMTEDELDLALQGQKLFLLQMAAESEMIMDFLTKVASLSGGATLENMKKAAELH